ncbi:MAG: transporter substrate-binding domain-containing protein [Burkholderiaceae bacterium]|nr:transporter substrate-binding domain-containing protein [Burkholderiaceae bacterium]
MKSRFPATRLLRWIRHAALPCLSAISHAVAAELPACSRPFSLAFHDHGMVYSKATQSGIDKDMVDELIKRSGCEFRLSVMPRARIWRSIESGELDFSTSGITNEARDKYAGFAWYLFNKYELLVRKDSGVASIAEFSSNAQMRIGGIRSFRYSSRLNQLVDHLAPQGRYIEVADHEQLLAMLKRNRIQAMIIEPFNYSQVENRALHVLTRTLDSGDPAVLHGLIMSKAALPEAEQRKWRALIDDMRADGTLLKIMRRYFPADDAKAYVTF